MDVEASRTSHTVGSSVAPLPELPPAFGEPPVASPPALPPMPPGSEPALPPLAPLPELPPLPGAAPPVPLVETQSPSAVHTWSPGHCDELVQPSSTDELPLSQA